MLPVEDTGQVFAVKWKNSGSNLNYYSDLGILILEVLLCGLSKEICRIKLICHNKFGVTAFSLEVILS